MEIPALFERVLALGRAEKFAEIQKLPAENSPRNLLRLFNVHREQLVRFAEGLSPSDRPAFVKAVAVLEHAVGGLGSVTTLTRLLPLLDDPNRTTLDWILRNTRSYWYYGLDARSVEEYDLALRRRAERAGEGIRRDLERQARDKERIVKAATERLYNAVRRGDLKAVRALLAKGADASVPAPDGTSLLNLARAAGNEGIVNELQSALSGKSVPL